MNKLAGVTFEKNIHGKVKRVTFDIKRHAVFIEDYLDHLRIASAKKDGDFKDWENVKAELDNRQAVKK